MLKVTDTSRLKEFGFRENSYNKNYYYDYDETNFLRVNSLNSQIHFLNVGLAYQEEALCLIYDLITAGIVIKE